METEKTGVINKEMEQACFQIIAYSGEAFSKMLKAMKICRSGDYVRADAMLLEASEILNQAHNVHTNLLVGEAQGNKIEYAILLGHAQDNLMNSILARTLIEEMMEMYKELKG